MLVISKLVILLLLAIASGSVAVTISNSTLFGPFRAFIQAKAPGWVSSLIHCYYCLSHWTSAVFFLVVYPKWIVTGTEFTTFLVNYFILVGTTTFVSTKLMVLMQQLKRLMSN